MRQLRVVIVGSGFSGLAVALSLRKGGLGAADDLAILERADAVGGTWRDNTYPGCACDVPSHIYSFSFAPKHDWSRVFAPQAEIREYVEQVTDAFDLRRSIRFGCEVVSATWCDAQQHWSIETRSAERYAAKVLVLATGALSNPSWPALRGLEQFLGETMHSARWNHAYDFRDKRVAVVGTGASAIQLIPQLQSQVARLHVMQRTPPWVLQRRDRAYTAVEKGALLASPVLHRLVRQSLFWMLEARILAFEHPRFMRVIEHLGWRNIARSIRAPDLRSRLRPKFTAGCKRLLLADDYYPALAAPNVCVHTAGIHHIEPHAVVLDDGERLEIDALVCGTGFDVHNHFGGMPVVGRGGRALAEVWRDGAQAFLGTTIAGFPNLFVMTGPNTGLGHHSMLVMIEAQAEQIRYLLRHMETTGASAVEPLAATQAAYNAQLQARMRTTVWKTGCHSWYLDPQGRNTTLWPGTASGFARRLRRFEPADYQWQYGADRGGQPA